MNLFEVLEKWNNYEEIETVELGGINEDYEYVIQELAYESLKEIRTNAEIIIENKIKELKRGYSGAQVGAAKNIVFVYLNQGYEKGLNSANKERIIKIKKKKV